MVVRPALTVLALVAGLAGCSQDDDGAPAARLVTPETARAATPSPASAARRLPQRPAPATTAGDLAQRLVAAEDTVRDPGASRASRADAAFTAQLLYRQLARRPGWLAPVLRASGRYRAAVRAHVLARRELRSMHHELSGTVPSWRIVPPAPAAELLRHYREGERRFGVPWQVLAAINLVETAMGRIRGTSVAGARGPMQFLPATWRAFGRGDIDDPHDAIIAAARYLAHNDGGRGRIDDALFRYNNHPAYVRAVKAYAGILRADPTALRGLHDWQVVYLTRRGDVWLAEGYRRSSPLPVGRYLRRHPDRLLGAATG